MAEMPMICDDYSSNATMHLYELNGVLLPDRQGWWSKKLKMEMAGKICFSLIWLDFESYAPRLSLDFNFLVSKHCKFYCKWKLQLCFMIHSPRVTKKKNLNSCGRYLSHQFWEIAGASNCYPVALFFCVSAKDMHYTRSNIPQQLLTSTATYFTPMKMVRFNEKIMVRMCEKRDEHWGMFHFLSFNTQALLAFDEWDATKLAIESRLMLFLMSKGTRNC